MSEYTFMPDYRTEFERSPRWVRVYFNRQVFAGSREMMLLRETNHLPLYYFPKKDVRATLASLPIVAVTPEHY
ncbi:MAG: DUF427 domain-containing protein, partial [Candidatus Poribacteria bacterium]